LPLSYASLPASEVKKPLASRLPRPAEAISERPIEKIADDRNHLQEGDRVLLIVEDDPNFARLLVDLSRDNGFKVLVASRGTEALGLARTFQPTAISLDVFLPDMFGWTVLNHLKQDLDTRHIPVLILTVDEDSRHGLSRGAFALVTKPVAPDKLEESLARVKEYVSPRRKQLLVIEDNPAEQLSIKELLHHDDIDVAVAATGGEGLAALEDQAFDCVVLDLHLPDMSGFELLERVSESPTRSDVPVVVFTGKELSAEEDAQLRTLARSVVVKDVESPERLLDQTALFLHRVVADLPREKRQMLEKLHRSDDALVDKRVLVVDDDVRNIFALSSVLERHGMTVVTAGTGREALARLEEIPDVAIVLMDIMMPEMDGYETMHAIRQNRSFSRLPLVALTAKAMKGDREKCLDAGASEYLAKPVNTEQLLAVLRILLHR
jgi:CheY-like chemotaxis protein